MAANANIGRIFAELGIDTTIGTDLAKARGQLEGGLSGLARGSIGALGTVATTIGAVGVAAGAMAGVVGGVAVNSFRNFETSVANAASVTGATGEAFKQAKENIAAVSEELGQRTIYSSSQAADAMYNLASAGYDVANMTTADLLPMLNLASGTQTDLAETTGITAATISQFGLTFNDSARVADVYSAAVSKSMLKTEGLGISMNYAGPVAHALNMSLEGTTALLGELSNKGFNAEQAGTGLRGALSALMKPTGDAAAALKEMGLSIEDVDPATHDFTDTLKLLQTHGLTAAQAVAIFGRETAPAVLALTSSADDVRKLTTELQNAGGAAQTLADEQIDTLSGSLDNMQGVIENILINTGAALAPAIRGIAGQIADAGPAIQEAILKIVGFFLDLGDRLTPAIGIIQEIGADIFQIFTGILQSLGGSTGGLAPAIANTVTRVLDAVRVAIVAIGPVIQAAITNIIGFIRQMAAALTPTFNNIINIIRNIIPIIQNLWVAFSPAVGAVIAGIVTALNLLSGAISTVTQFAAQHPQITNFIVALAGIVAALAVIPTISAAVSAAWVALQAAWVGVTAALSGGIAIIAGPVGLAIGLFAALAVAWQKDLGGIRERVTALWGDISAAFQGAISRLAPIWDALEAQFEALPGYFDNALTALGPVWDRLGKEFDKLRPIFNNVVKWLGGAWDKISAALSSGIQKIKNFAKKYGPSWEQISAAAMRGIDLLESAFNTLILFLTPVWNLIKGLLQNGVLIFQEFVDNLGPTWTNLQKSWDSLKIIFGQIVEQLTPVWNQIKTAWTSFLTALGGEQMGQATGVGATLAGVLNWLTGVIAGLLQYVAQHPQITAFALTIVKMGGAVIAALPGVIAVLIRFGGAVVDWLGRAVTAVQGYYATWQGYWAEYGPTVTGIVSGIVTTLTGWYNSIVTWLGKAVTFVQNQYTIWKGYWDEYSPAVLGAINTIVTTLSGWYNSIITWVGGAVTYVQTQYETWSKRWEDFKTAVDKVTGPIITTLSGWKTDIEKYLGGAVGIVTSILNGDWSKAWSGFETAVSTAKENVLKKVGEWKTDIEKKFDEVKKSVSKFLGEWSGLWGGVEDETTDDTKGEGEGGDNSSGGGLLSKVWNGLKTAFETLKTELGKKYDEIKSAASTFITDLGTILSGLSSSFDGVKTAVGLAIGGLLTTISTNLSNIYTAVSTFLNTQWITAWALIVQIIDTANTNIGLAINAINATVTTVSGLILTTLQNFNTNWGIAWVAVVQTTDTAAGNLGTALNEINITVTNITGQIVASVQSFNVNWVAAWDSVVSSTQTAAGNITAALNKMATDATTAMNSFVSNIEIGLQNGLNAINNQQTAYYNAGKALTDAYANGMSAGGKNTTKTLTQTNEKNNKQLPHSPAKEGPFRKLPKWDTVFITPMLDSLKKMGTIKETLAGQLADIRNMFTLGKGLPFLNLTGNLEGVTKALHKVLDTPKTESSSSSKSNSSTTQSGGVWSKTTSNGQTTTTQNGNMTQAQAQALLAKLQKLIEAQAPVINIKDVKLDQAYNFNKLISDVEKYQTAQRRQRGAYL